MNSNDTTAVAIASGLGLRLLGLAAKSLATAQVALWPLMYVPPVIGMVAAVVMLSGLSLWRRRRAMMEG